MAPNLANRLWQYFLQLNLFKKSSSNEQTLPKERLATRIYVCALFGVLLVITSVAASMVRTIEKMEYLPSHTKFLQLRKNYRNTLRCPCSRFDIVYNTFVTTRVDFHQVCSSQFIQQAWIDLISAKENISFASINDFRVTLSFFWQTVAGLCTASNRSWADVVASFSASRILTSTAVAEEVVRSQVQADLNNQIAQSQATLARNLLAIRRMTSGNQIVSGLQTNFYLRYPPEDSGPWESPKMSPRKFDDCSCLSIKGCPRPATFNDSHGHLITMPGMIADCLIIDGTLASTLECYYNQTCISLLHEPLPKDVKPLSNSSSSHFSINSTVQMLLDKLMIDEMTNDIRFDLFYTGCNPAYCSYSYTRRFDVLFIGTTIVGIFDVLSMVLAFVAPIIASASLRWKNRVLPNDNIPHAVFSRHNLLHIVWNRIQLLPNYIRQTIVTLNIFESQAPRTPTNIYREQLLTRLFIFLIIISSTTVALYTVFVEQNQVVTISHPSLEIYQELYNNNPTTLQCSCSQLSIPYKAFLNVTFVLHQICSSDFVSPLWLNYLASFDPTLVPSWTEKSTSHDFRTMGASYFQLLATFCSLAQINIEDAQRVFTDTQFINDRIPTPPLFVQQTKTIIDSFITVTRNDFVRTFDWIHIAFIASQLFNGANGNFDIIVSDEDQVTVMFTARLLIDRISDDGVASSGSCSCGLEHLYCFVIPELYTNASDLNPIDHFLFFQVLKIGCIPLTGFINSKIAWWYNVTYLEYIQATYSMVIPFQSQLNTKPLNASIPSQFGDVDMIDLVREMMLETLIDNNTRFDQFYYECAPVSCSYTNVRRRNTIVVLFLLIAICNGLNQGLKIIVPLIGKLIFFCIDRWKNRNVRQRLPSINARLKHHSSIIYQAIRTINLFKTTTTDETNVRQQQIYTRIYLFLFISSLSGFLFYTAIIERSITRTQLLPTIMDYEKLVNLYSDGVNCPCTHASIFYKEFITELRVNSFQEACMTDVIDLALLSGLRVIPGMPRISTNNFASWVKFFIYSLQLLCTLAKESVDNSIAAFHSSAMVVNQLMSRIQFMDEMNETLNRFQKKTPIAFARTLDLIRTTAQGNALMSMFSSNWDLVVAEKGKGKNASFLNVPVIHYNTEQNTSCSCATLRTCTMPLQVSTSRGVINVEGLVFGCYLLETLLLSSMACFYSDTCIDDIRQSLKAPSFSPNDSIRLNASSTRFGINDTIETMAYEMFIESWTNNVSYEMFFNSCAPDYCTYTYHYRFDALELLTTFLSVFAGLSLVIYFIVPHLVNMFKKIRNRFRVTPLE